MDSVTRAGWDSKKRRNASVSNPLKSDAQPSWTKESARAVSSGGSSAWIVVLAMAVILAWGVGKESAASSPATAGTHHRPIDEALKPPDPFGPANIRNLGVSRLT